MDRSSQPASGSGGLYCYSIMEEFMLTVVLNTLGTTVTKTVTFQVATITVVNPGEQRNIVGKAI